MKAKEITRYVMTAFSLGIGDGVHDGSRVFAAKFGTQEELLAQVDALIA